MTLKAVLEDGREVEYLPEVIGEGGMKTVHFTADRSSVVCFFKDPTASNDPERRRRLQAIVGKYNPILNSGKLGSYWKDLFCWPTGIVVKPELGVVAPAYPKNFFFESGNFKGNEKVGTYFTSRLRGSLSATERGTLLNYFQICIRIARAVRRMHNAGYAHSDLSGRNILVDPTTGSAVIIDIDSLVVSDLFPPDVVGTPGYIAPEVLATQELDLDDPKRILPSRRTDEHALGILIYEYLLKRHPLKGPKVNSTRSTEEDEYLSMGPKALWIENPSDKTTGLRGRLLPSNSLGPYLSPLFEAAFVSGLHNPEKRPSASDWERALVKTTDLLLPCRTPSCEQKWFVFDSTVRPRCPFCNSPCVGTMPILNFYRQNVRRPGQFGSESHRLVVWEDRYLYTWHAFDNVFAGESADRTSLGYFTFHRNRWFFVNEGSEAVSVVNEGSEAVSVVGSETVPTGDSVELREGQQIRFSKQPNGRLAVVQMVRC